MSFKIANFSLVFLLDSFESHKRRVSGRFNFRSTNPTSAPKFKCNVVIPIAACSSNWFYEYPDCPHQTNNHIKHTNTKAQSTQKLKQHTIHLLLIAQQAWHSNLIASGYLAHGFVFNITRWRCPKTWVAYIRDIKLWGLDWGEIAV